MIRFRDFLSIPALVTVSVIAAESYSSPTYDPTDPASVAQREADQSAPGRNGDLSGPAVDASTSDRPDPVGGGPMAAESVESLLTRECGQCHGPRRQKAGVQVVPVESMYQGASEDWIVRPGKPSESLLLTRITLPAGHPDLMPPNGPPMTPEQIHLIEQWISSGGTAEAARNRPQPRGPAKLPPRIWGDAYLALDLTPDQRSAARTEIRGLQERLRAFQSTHGKEMRRLQQAARNGPTASPAMEPEDRAAANKRLQELRRTQPKPEPVQEKLWKLLTSEQQSAFRQRLAELSAARGGERRDRRDGRGSQPGETPPDRPGDARN